MALKDKKILLGITGSISAYKACDLIQRLKDQGAEVRALLTSSAAKLIQPQTFAALTNHPVYINVWTDSGDDKAHGPMDHIALARWADIFIIAPCTAHTLGELAQGLTGSLLSLTYMAYAGNVYVAPAMNTIMLQSAALQRNIALLQSKGDIILPTGAGLLACGENGDGKLLTVEQIILFIKSHLALRTSYPNLKGKKVLLSAGHTQEKIDDVRFISNRSSGKTALAIARALVLCGAQVELVAGIMEENIPAGVFTQRVKSSHQFHQTLLAAAKQADIIIMAAAIADFVPEAPIAGKIKGSQALQQLALKPSVNILSELGQNKSASQILVGFALETESSLGDAQRKLTEKNCDLLVLNTPIDQGSGFGEDTVKATILNRQQKSLPTLMPLSKFALADQLLAEINACQP